MLQTNNPNLSICNLRLPDVDFLFATYISANSTQILIPNLKKIAIVVGQKLHLQYKKKYFSNIFISFVWIPTSKKKLIFLCNGQCTQLYEVYSAKKETALKGHLQNVKI